MGSKYEIYAWGPHQEDTCDYSYKLMWTGNSWMKALYHLWKIKHQGWGCVRMECR